MQYKFPDFGHEYIEALRYREFERIGKTAWVELAKENGFITDYSKIKDVLSNVDLDFESLDPEKKERFEKHFATGILELPIAVKFSDTDYDLLGGNTRTAGMIKHGIDPKIWVVDMTKENINENMKSEVKEDCWKNYKMNGMKQKNGKQVPNCVPKETKEQTDSSSSGSFEAGFSPVQSKANIQKIYNAKLTEKQIEVDEAMDASSSGAYDVPFGNGGKNPLKIDGVKSIAKSRAVKDKNFPKWGGPGGVFVKVKEKCKKFPYCNQGINAIEIIKEINGLDQAIIENAEKHGFSIKDVENLVSKEIKQIFI